MNTLLVNLFLAGTPRLLNFRVSWQDRIRSGHQPQVEKHSVSSLNHGSVTIGELLNHIGTKTKCPRALQVPVLKRIEAFAAQVAQFTIVSSKTVQRLLVLEPQLRFETSPKRRHFIRRNAAGLIFQYHQRRLPEHLIIEPFKRSRSTTRSQFRPLP